MRYTSPFFFFNDTATTEIYTLSLHDALPIWMIRVFILRLFKCHSVTVIFPPTPRPLTLRSYIDWANTGGTTNRSEEHTSELQSHLNLVCRLLLEKKKKRWQTNKTLLSVYDFA